MKKVVLSYISQRNFSDIPNCDFQSVCLVAERIGVCRSVF